MGRHARIAQLAMENGDGLSVADVGAGVGRTVRELLAYSPSVVHAIDRGSLLDDDVLASPSVRSVIADLESDSWGVDPGSVDRAVSLNVAEHVADPVNHVVGLHRLLHDDGVAVLAHADWGTAMFSSSDDDLTRELVNCFITSSPSWENHVDGLMGRKLLGLIDPAAQRGAPFEVVGVHTWADAHRRFDDDSLAWKVAVGLVAAAREDSELGSRIDGWIEDLRDLSRRGRFVFSVMDVALVLRKTS